MAEDQAPVFQIQRIYLKGLSLEQPNSPGITLSQEQTPVDSQIQLVQLDLGVHRGLFL